MTVAPPPSSPTSDDLLKRAIAAHQAGRADEAAVIYRQVAARDPRNAAVWPLLGLTQQAAGDLASAAASFGRAISLNPADARLRLQLIDLLLQQGRAGEAVAAAREARTVAPQNLDVRFALVRALSEAGEPAQALEANRAALGLAHETLPRIDQLAAATRRALALDPGFAEAWRTLSMMVRRTAFDDEMAAMERRFADPTTTDEQRMHLGFALGRGFDDLARWDEAHRYFVEANRLKRASISFSLEPRLAEMAWIEALFADLPALPERQAGDPAPILVVGLPRSGKTTIEHVLGRHPDVARAGELEALDIVVKAFVAAHRLDRPGAGLTAIPRAAWDELGSAYLAAAAGAAGGRRIVDTMPSNFRYVGFLRLALPGARIIHTVREPQAHGVALFQKFFASSTYDYTYDFKEIAAYRAAYLRLMARWHAAFPGFVLDIDAAAAAAKPELRIGELLAFCGLPWNAACFKIRNVEQRQGESAAFVASGAAEARLAPYLDGLSATASDPGAR